MVTQLLLCCINTETRSHQSHQQHTDYCDATGEISKGGGLLNFSKSKYCPLIGLDDGHMIECLAVIGRNFNISVFCVKSNVDVE